MIDQAEIDRMLRRHSAMVGERAAYEGDWAKCFSLSFPERGAGLVGGHGAPYTQSKQARARMMDDTGRTALRTFCSALMSGTTPESVDWFELDAGTETDGEKLWLAESAKLILENLRASNFPSEAMDATQDAGAVGWFVLYIGEGEQGGFEFETWPISECFIAQSRKAGPADIVYRPYAMTVEQIVAEFGLEQVSELTAKKWSEHKLTDLVQVLRVIEPRRSSNGVLARTMPYRSVTLEVTAKHPLRESGYHEFPCSIPRMSRLPGTAYAVGPMLDVVADCETLNDLTWNELKGVELAIRPPLKAKGDGVLNPRAVRFGPGVVIPMADTDNLQVLETQGRFDVSWTQKDRLQGQIRRALMADQLEPVEKNGMTAYEVSVRQQQMRQLLGPIFARYQSEYLTALVERCFGIAYRAGVLGPAPESLAERIYTVRYRNPFAVSQQLEEVEALEAVLVSTGQLAQAKGSMDPWDVIDTDAAQRAISEGRGVPQRVMRSKEDVEDLRAQRAKQAQQQQEQAIEQESQLAAMQKLGVQ